jgi:hypothetical protein
MPEGQEHQESIAMTMAVSFGRLDQPLDLIDRQVLPCPNVSIFGSAWCNCSILVVGATRRRRGLTIGNPPLACPHCSIDSFMNSFLDARAFALPISAV